MNKIAKRILVTPIGIIGGLLGALGGADNSSKAFRRWGIPSLLVIVAFFKITFLLDSMFICYSRYIKYGLWYS